MDSCEGKRDLDWITGKRTWAYFGITSSIVPSRLLVSAVNDQQGEQLHQRVRWSLLFFGK